MSAQEVNEVEHSILVRTDQLYTTYTDSRHSMTFADPHLYVLAPFPVSMTDGNKETEILIR